MIRTSYFWKVKNGDVNENECVSIALWNPRGVFMPQYKELAPTQSILTEYKYNGEDWNRYVRRYNNEVLAKLDVHKVARELDGKVLLCYEGKNNPRCHRHLVREWLRTAGYECEEI